MSNTYTYEVTNLNSDASGIVVSVDFTITASDGTHSFTHNYHTALNPVDGTPIPYADLTKEQVIEWVKKLVGTASEEQADAELTAYIKRSATTISSGTPWETIVGLS